MKLAIHTLSLVTALGFATRASADVPAWCSAIGNNRIEYVGDLKSATDAEDPRNALKDLVGKVCKPDAESTAHQAELDAAREKWSKRLALTEADWSDVAEYATLGQGSRMNGNVRLNTGDQEMGIGDTLKRAWSAFDALDQYVMIGADSGASNDLALDHDYLVDALGSHLTEAGRLAYVQKCINSSSAVKWAMCQGDIDQLDVKKLSDELRADKPYSGADKVRVRIAAHELEPLLVEHAAKVKKLIASDPGYEQVFKLAAATRKEWAGRVKSDAAMIELASAMDDARATNSRKAFADCEEKTWTAWKTAMATVPAKKFAGMHNDIQHGKNFIDTAVGPIIGVPGVYLASVALNTCMTIGQDRGAQRDILVRALGDAMARWPGFRGPRTATETAIMMAGIVLDDRDAKLDFPGVARKFGGGGGSHGGGGDGVVATLVPAGKLVTVSFKPQMVKQVQCAQVKYSSRITQIRPDGSLVYEATCMRNETVTVNKASRPQKVSPRYLQGVKPGMYVTIVEDVVTGVWSKPDAPNPTMVFGVALK
jgi:hypothetical protein